MKQDTRRVFGTVSFYRGFADGGAAEIDLAQDAGIAGLQCGDEFFEALADELVFVGECLWGIDFGGEGEVDAPGV